MLASCSIWSNILKIIDLADCRTNPNNENNGKEEEEEENENEELNDELSQ